MDSEELRDQNWMLSYEANVHGWLKSNSPKDHVEKDPGFAFLKANGISFYRPVNTKSTIPPKSTTSRTKKMKKKRKSPQPTVLVLQPFSI
jgi:hypothetical protein